MAALYGSSDNVNYEAHCGGTIIHQRFVLTAGHCIERFDFTSRSVLIGSNRLSNNLALIEVEKVIVHEKYSETNYALEFDIALLKLRNIVEFIDNKVAPVQLPENKDFKLKKGTQVQVTGWGETEHDEHMVEILRQATVEMDYQGRCQLNEHVNAVCTKSLNRGPCYGDSGAPLTYNNVQIGVASYVRGCGKGRDVYTNVANFLDWINATITNNL